MRVGSRRPRTAVLLVVMMSGLMVASVAPVHADDAFAEPRPGLAGSNQQQGSGADASVTSSRSLGVGSSTTPGHSAGPRQSEHPALQKGFATGPAKPWWLAWDRDLDGDRIDDRLNEVARAGPDASFAATGAGTIRISAAEDGAPLFDLFVRYDPRLDAFEIHGLARAIAALGLEVRTYAFADIIHVRAAPADTFAVLLALPGVMGLEADRTVVPMLDVASRSSRAAGHPSIGNGARARFAVSGLQQVVAILDTGIDDEHPAFGLGKRSEGGYDATYWLASRTALGQVDPDSDDLHTHGTHVAGIVSSADPRGRYFGIAPDATLLDVKVMSRELAVGPFDIPRPSADLGERIEGTTSTVIEGIDFVMRYNDNESYLNDRPRNKARVAVMSFGETEPDPNGTSVLATAVDRLSETGVTVVAAAGNCGPGATSEQVFGCTSIGADVIPAPGSAASAITVGALDDQDTLTLADDTVALFSGRGPNGGEPKPNLVAPGVRIAAPMGDPRTGENATENLYQNLTGTSMAAPMVAGVAALLLHLDPSLSPLNIKQILMGSARVAGPELWSPAYGAGALDAFTAVAVAYGVLDLEHLAEERERAVDLFGETDAERETADHTHEDGIDDDHHDDSEPAATPTRNPFARKLNAAPRVDFLIDPNPVLVGQPATFVDRTVDPDGDPIKLIIWDFGDGETANGSRVVHTYERSGTYIVRLQVIDENGSLPQAGYARRELEVLPNPEIAESPGVGVWVLLLVATALAAIARQRGQRNRPQ